MDTDDGQSYCILPAGVVSEKELVYLHFATIKTIHWLLYTTIQYFIRQKLFSAVTCCSSSHLTTKTLAQSAICASLRCARPTTLSCENTNTNVQYGYMVCDTCAAGCCQLAAAHPMQVQSASEGCPSPAGTEHKESGKLRRRACSLSTEIAIRCPGPLPSQRWQ